jgi:hypothetical protein
MTNSSRNILLALLCVAAPAVFAQTPQPAKPVAVPAPAARPVARPAVPSANQQWQRQVDRQQLQNQQQQNAVRQQLHQGNLDQQRNSATDPGLRTQLNNADQSQQQMYRARQDDATRRYQTTPRPGEPVRNAPATAGSAGR